VLAALCALIGSGASLAATAAPKSSSPSTNVVAKCGYATIVVNTAQDGKTPIFRASFAKEMVDELVLGGCAQFYQGCNVCSVRYEGCSVAEKAACTDTACLEKTCERKVKCSAKSCTARGKIPNCKARLARTQCRRTLFE